VRTWRGCQIGQTRLKISARSQLKGTITEIVKGSTTAHVKLDLGGAIVISAISNAAVDEFKLAVGPQAYAVVEDFRRDDRDRLIVAWPMPAALGFPQKKKAHAGAQAQV